MKRSTIQDHTELCSSIGLELASKNRKKGDGKFNKTNDLAIHWAFLRPTFKNISFFMGNFYQSSIKMLNNLLHKNKLKFIRSATIWLISQVHLKLITLCVLSVHFSVRNLHFSLYAFSTFMGQFSSGQTLSCTPKCSLSKSP